MCIRDRYISIDIGGTAIKYGIIGEDAKIMLKKSMPTEAGKGGPAILDKVIGIVNEMLVSHSEIAGICISTAGMVDTETGSIFYSAPLIPNYAGTQFKKILEEKFQIPCEVENDVNCAGLAEYRNGAAKGSKVALVLTIGTGIGGCCLLYTSSTVAASPRKIPTRKKTRPTASKKICIAFSDFIKASLVTVSSNCSFRYYCSKAVY